MHRKSCFSVALAVSCLATGACKDLTAKLPAGTVDPSSYRTPEAAAQMAQYARFAFQAELFEFTRNSGGLADELRSDNFGSPVGVFPTDLTASLEIDSRHLPEERAASAIEQGGPLLSKGPWGNQFAGYGWLHKLRSSALQARQTLLAYAPGTPPAVRGEMFAYEAYAVVMLADLFCSGVPLTTVDFEQDFTYRAGSSTEELYAHAAALFDSAMALSADDDRVRGLAALGKGRTLLARGRYAEAGAVVASVPSGFSFAAPFTKRENSNAAQWESFIWRAQWLTGFFPTSSGYRNFRYVADREGGNGLPFVSVPDPRVALVRANGTQATQRATSPFGVANWYPAERPALVAGDHVEARLIEAEAALHAESGEWLTILNALRTTSTTCTVKTTPSCAATAPAGTGGVARLPLLTDPALDPIPEGKTAFDVRVDLLFRERAYWLFLRGHRQGDLRRLVRVYGRRVDQTYPWGTYRGATGVYHPFIDLPIPDAERLNPYFIGCLRRDG